MNRMKAVEQPLVLDEVERVARAIAASDGFDGFNPAFDWRPFEPNARAAIEAMHPIGDEVREALEPFAKAAEGYSDAVLDGTPLLYGEVTVGHCRKARAALSTIGRVSVEGGGE